MLPVLPEITKRGINFRLFIEEYVNCALWASSDCQGQPLDKNFGWEQFAEETKLKFIKDCVLFYDANFESSRCRFGSLKLNSSTAGQNFWLVRKGIGVGFWDYAVDPQIFPEVNLYVGDDGMIYC